MDPHGGLCGGRRRLGCGGAGAVCAYAWLACCPCCGLGKRVRCQRVRAAVRAGVVRCIGGTMCARRAA